jgi:DNA modification methylase
VGSVIEQKITDRYAIYNGDCIEVMAGIPDASIHLSVYSPPFATESGGALYHYSSSDRDLSNCRTYEEFFEHYEFVIRELFRITAPGRMTCVHCMDVPSGNTGHGDRYTDFPGDIIRLHERSGWRQASPRVTIWKEPLAVRNRTLTKSLAHRTVVDDSTNCTVAGADYLLIFRRKGKNEVPVTHARGLLKYAGERKPPADVLRYKGWTGNQIQNRYSHWIWRQYASSVWDDIRGNTGTRTEGVLPYREARDAEDEKHVHPLQLDVYTRALELYSNPGERFFEPFMGVGSGVYAAFKSGRFGMGSELKPSYYRQAVKNLLVAESEPEDSEQMSILDGVESDTAEEQIA